MTVPETTVRAIVLKGFGGYCRSQRLDAEALLSSVGLDPAATYEFEDTILLNDFAQLLHNAAEASKDPCFGLNFARHYPVGGTGLMGQMLIHTNSVRDAAVAFTKFVATIVHPIDITFEEDEANQGCLEWSYADSFTAPRLQYISQAAALFILRIRENAIEDWTPTSAEFEHDALPCRQKVTDVYGANVKYNCARNRIFFPATALSLAMKSADPRLMRMLQHYAGQELQTSVEPADFVSRANKIILQNLASGRVTLDSLAGILEITPRSLQWQLSQAGTTFEKILNENRRKTAEPLLSDTTMALSEIAKTVGFSELSSFSRAANAWFGMSPRAYRQQRREAKAGLGKGSKPIADGDADA